MRAIAARICAACRQITNFGPSSVSAMQTFIRWPMETYDGDYLLYLLETPRVVRGDGQCWADYVNPLNVSVSSVGLVVQCQCEVYRDTSRTSPLQGRLAVLKVTVCHAAGHYGEEYDD